MELVKKGMAVFLAALIFFVGGALGDLFSSYIPIKSVEFKKKVVSLEETEAVESEAEPEAEKAVVSENDIDKRAEEILKTMTLDEKIYQMMFIKPETITGVGTCIAAGDATREAIEKYPVGGFIYSADNVVDKNQLKTMIENTQSYSKIPLFIGINEEGGNKSELGGFEGLDVEKAESAAEIGKTEDTSKSYNTAKSIASGIKELGFNVNFAPVADVDINETGVNRRSFGSNPAVVGKMALGFILGLQDNGVSACLKYFPGEGAVSGNTHSDYTSNERSEEEIMSGEIEAFRSGIDNGCDFVMIGHSAAPKLTGSQISCLFSEKVVDKLLKEELGFGGIAITDEMNVEVVSANYSAEKSVLEAIKAGNDMIFMPQDLEKAIEAVRAEIGNEISERRIDESVLRILKVKIKRGIIK